MTAPVAVLLVLFVVIAATLVAMWGRRLRAQLQERDRLAAQLDRRLAELFSLQELSYVLSESLQQERIIEQVTHFVMRFLDAEGAALLLADESGKDLVVATAAGSLAHLAGRRVADADPGLVLKAIGTERVQVVPPHAADPPPLLADCALPGVAAAPMRAHGVTVGAIVVAGPRRAAFGVEDVRLMSTVATHTAVVLANARFFDLIRQGKEEWEAAFEALTAGLAVVDDSARIRRANRALAEMVQQPLPALVGQEVSALLPQQAAPAIGEALAAAEAGERRPPLVIRAEAGARTLRLTTAPMPRPHAERAALLLVEDLTEQEALQAQLIQHEKLAAVGQLVSGVAHELNNPLTSIAGLSELLLEQADTPARARMHLEVIRDQAERAGRIVQNLLTFARRGPPAKRRVNLSDIARRTTLLMAREFQLHGVTLEARLATRLDDVLGDEHQLLQVVVNLLTNALQAVAALPRDRPRQVVVETVARDGNASLSVRDSGPGIPDGIADRIFTPFFTTKEPGKGTGLGLAISYRIIEAHGGSLSMTRDRGETVFTVSLPVAYLAAPPRPTAEAEPSPAVPRRRVLIVDDDPAARRLARAFFGREGHAVDAVAGADGLSAAAREGYDLIVVDTRAACPTGESVLEALLKRDPEVRARLLAASDAARHRDVRPPAVECVRKPFDLKTLRAAARRIWGETGSKA